MYLFFDTETTGLPDYNADLIDAKQPHVVQLALLLTDEQGREMFAFKAPIIPEAFTIDEQGRAFEVHKITNDMARAYGITMKQALAMFRMCETKARLKIAHNYRFDGFLLKSAHARYGVEPLDPPINKYCTMKAAEALKSGGTLERATLAAFYKHCTGKDHENAHDALADVRACKECFFWILKQGLYTEQPRVVPKGAAA